MDPEAPFLVTGLGASGTRWLANHLNKSNSWTVHHEPNPSYYADPDPRTGSVDSTVRHCAITEDYLENGRLAVITRDPSAIARHCVYKGTWNRVMDELEDDLLRLKFLLTCGAITIKFSEMVHDRNYLCGLEARLGVYDVFSDNLREPIGHAEPEPSKIMQVQRAVAVARHIAAKTGYDLWC